LSYICHIPFPTQTVAYPPRRPYPPFLTSVIPSLYRSIFLRSAAQNNQILRSALKFSVLQSFRYRIRSENTIGCPV